MNTLGCVALGPRTSTGPRIHARPTPRLGAAGRAAMRVLIWIALWAEALRTVATVAGVWSAGSWGIVATLLVGVLAPAWMFLLSPTWLGWRILYRVDLPGPRRAKTRVTAPGTARAAVAAAATAAARLREPLLLAACWLSPLCPARDLAGVRVFARLRGRRPFPEARRAGAEPWTILAAALQAERQGNTTLVAQTVDVLACLPPGARFPWLARVHGGEALVLSATRRRDWEAVLRYAAIARGRTVRLLTAVAEAHVHPGAGRGPRQRLWLRWALAPGRLRTWPLTREASRRLGAPGRVAPPPPGPAASFDEDRVASTGSAGPTVDPRLVHVRLLGQAASGVIPSLPEILALASAWSRELDPAAMARLGARALELDVRHHQAATDALREEVLGELADLADRADGELPAPEAVPTGLAADLVHRARERLAQGVDRALAPLGGREGRGAALGPLEAWMRWLALRAVLEDVERRAGRVMLTMLWHGVVRNTVWRWAWALFNGQPGDTAWMAHLVFTWLADHAERVGDLGGQLTNRENARIALATEARN